MPPPPRSKYALISIISHKLSWNRLHCVSLLHINKSHAFIITSGRKSDMSNDAGLGLDHDYRVPGPVVTVY
jgi:hypothetical protein